ncbi:SDR family NAD(P)-dependent oxidoreductase [Demetria terragena]|uniref:SDR family NAD(P)-dependent oxidoreductase n=1 Tax=Demetria terragena TaxID=63959 RepID=UPI0003A1C02F|nr:SDR family NAD(P)-dependent oxidoreductase [Demetria terragena]
MDTNVNPTDPPVALITGGSAGLGLELVRALHSRGWEVVTNARTISELRSATSELARLLP